MYIDDDLLAVNNNEWCLELKPQLLDPVDISLDYNTICEQTQGFLEHTFLVCSSKKIDCSRDVEIREVSFQLERGLTIGGHIIKISQFSR